MKIPQELKPEHVTAIRDSREQTPFNLAPLKEKVDTLTTGDYSIVGLEHVISLERKSLQDLVGCCGHGRERFERELARMRAFAVRGVIVEGTWSQIELQQYRSTIHPNSVIGSIMSWQQKGINFMFCDNAEMAGKLAAKFLFSAARSRWRENLPMLNSILSSIES